MVNSIRVMAVNMLILLESWTGLKEIKPSTLKGVLNGAPLLVKAKLHFLMIVL